MKLIIFTNNQHKVHEIKAILSLDIPILSYKEVYDYDVDVVEDGTTFEENAILKVNALPNHPNHIYLAEDSGIEVDYLDGAPGIYSARYAGANASREDLCSKLLKECYGAGNREAQYQAVMALRFPDDSVITFSGICRGHLSHEMIGDGGFGYDPIFIPEYHDQTFAQMTTNEKHALSHRFYALKKVKDYLMTTQNSLKS